MTAPLTTITPDVFPTANPAYLQRGAEVFLTDSDRWLVSLGFAYVSGGWRAVGTDAGYAEMTAADGRPIGLAPGHYTPVGQVVTALDARALATGIRTALAELPCPGSPAFMDGAQEMAHRIDDPRILPDARGVGGSFLVWRSLVHFDIDDGYGEQLAAFLEGGACRLMPGRPKGTEHQDEASAVDKRRHDALEAQRRRIVRAIAEGNLTGAEAAAELNAIRTELDAIAQDMPLAG